MGLLSPRVFQLNQDTALAWSFLFWMRIDGNNLFAQGGDRRAR
jgi:hypothetical protein